VPGRIGGLREGGVCAKFIELQTRVGTVLKRILCAGLLLLLLSSEASAQWTPTSDEKWCDFKRSFVDGTDLRISVSKDFDIGTLSLWNNKWKSIADDREYSVRFETDTGYVGTFTASGMRTSGGSTGLFVPITPRGTLITLAKARYVELTTKGRRIGRYDMTGASSAMVEALRCVVAESSEDPFSI
jgi:hypothetical protein